MRTEGLTMEAGGAAHHCGLAAIFCVVSTLGYEDVALWEQPHSRSSTAGSRSPELADRLFFCD